MPTDATPLVHDYLIKKTLSKIGYRFDDNELTDFEVDYYATVASIFSELEQKELRQSKKGKHK